MLLTCQNRIFLYSPKLHCTISSNKQSLTLSTQMHILFKETLHHCDNAQIFTLKVKWVPLFLFEGLVLKKLYEQPIFFFMNDGIVEETSGHRAEGPKGWVGTEEEPVLSSWSHSLSRLWKHHKGRTKAPPSNLAYTELWTRLLAGLNCAGTDGLC